MIQNLQNYSQYSTDPGNYLSYGASASEEDVANVKPVTQTIKTDPTTGEQMMTVSGRPQDLSADNPLTPTVLPAGQPAEPVAPMAAEAPMQAQPIQLARAATNTMTDAAAQYQIPPDIQRQRDAIALQAKKDKLLGDPNNATLVAEIRRDGQRIAQAEAPAAQVAAAPAAVRTDVTAPTTGAVAATPTTGAIDYNKQFLDNLNDPDATLKLAQDKNAPPELRAAASRQYYDQQSKQKQMDELQAKFEEASKSRNPGLAVTKLMQAKGEEGSLFKAYLYNRFGLHDLAADEQKKLGAGTKWSNAILADGSAAWIKSSASGLPLEGYTAAGPLDQKDLMQYAAQSKQVTTSGDLYQTRDAAGKTIVVRQQADERGNVRWIDANTNKSVNVQGVPSKLQNQRYTASAENFIGRTSDGKEVMVRSRFNPQSGATEWVDNNTGQVTQLQGIPRQVREEAALRKIDADVIASYRKQFGNDALKALAQIQKDRGPLSRDEQTRFLSDYGFMQGPPGVGNAPTPVAPTAPAASAPVAPTPVAPAASAPVAPAPVAPTPSAPVAPAAPAPVAPAASAAVPGNNYGNIRPVGANTGFQSYATPGEGIAAIDKNLAAYGQKGINTLSKIISTWAPPNENPTQALIANAAKRLGINPDQQLDLSNPAVRHMVTGAIMQQEQGANLFAAASPAAPTMLQTAAPAGAAVAAIAPLTPRGLNEPETVYKARKQAYEDQVKSQRAEVKAIEKSAREVDASEQKDLDKKLNKVRIDLPKVESNTQNMIDTVERVLTHPGFKDVIGLPSISGILNLPTTDARNFRSTYDQLSGQQFIAAYDSLRGTGSISEKEGIRAEASIAALKDPRISEKEFTRNAEILKTIIKNNVDKMRLQVGRDPKYTPLSTKDQKAYDWARAHPRDPMARRIKDTIEGQY